MHTNAELRAIARKSLSGAWGMAVLVILIAIISSIVGMVAENTGDPDSFAGPLLSLLITGPLTFGLFAYFLRTVRGERPELPVLFSGFLRYWPTLALSLLIAIFIFLWAVLFIISGIIAALRYSMAYFILHDNPGMSPLDAIRQSGEMMRGYKGKLFLLMLSFIGWAFLCALTLGIGYLWLAPYYMTSIAAFYENLRAIRQPASDFAADPARPSAPH